jgi:hypothetical protein
MNADGYVRFVSFRVMIEGQVIHNPFTSMQLLRWTLRATLRRSPHVAIMAGFTVADSSATKCVKIFILANA